MASDEPRLFRAHSTKYLTGATGVITNPNLRRTRTPRDLPIHIHDLLVKWFLERFGVDYRGRSLFCTGDISIAAGYRAPSATVITLEPIGDFSLCFSTKCKDLFGHYQFNWSAADTPHERIRADMDALDFLHYRNDGLKAAAASGHEVMLVAERFRYSLA